MQDENADLSSLSREELESEIARLRVEYNRTLQTELDEDETHRDLLSHGASGKVFRSMPAPSSNLLIYTAGKHAEDTLHINKTPDEAKKSEEPPPLGEVRQVLS
jgi:hypothetical protein